MSLTWNLPDDRYFDPEPTIKRAAMEIYERVRDLPVISPHGHVDPHLFSEEGEGFGSPADLMIIPDHYVFRMLHSQGFALGDLGIARWTAGRSNATIARSGGGFARTFTCSAARHRGCGWHTSST